MSRWRVLREPAVPILLAATVVHIVRRDLVDIAVFLGTAVVIVIDAGRPRVAATADDAPRQSRIWVAAALAVMAAVIALAPPATVGARAVMILIGILAAVVVLTSHHVVASPERPRGWVWWAVIGVATSLWELTSFIWGEVRPDEAANHPAISDLVEPLLTAWLGRVVFLLLWVAAGWWLVGMLQRPVARSRQHVGAVRECGE